MKEYLNLEDFKIILFGIEKRLSANKEYLCKLDSFIGDGDHGLTISRGFKNAVDIIEQGKYKSISELLIMFGNRLTSTMGGASGIIFGILFKSMGEAVPENKIINLEDFNKMLEAAMQKIMQFGKAAPGDKTILDSMGPALKRTKELLVEKISMKDALLEIVRAAEQGAIATKDMIASRGRAKYLGERSIGYQDAGATSFYLILSAVYESI
jgi:dihydroxyacetone kinase phosphoprotein-dependent L subunit